MPIRSVAAHAAGHRLISGVLPAAASRPGHDEHGYTGSAVIAYIFPRYNLFQPGETEARKMARINYAFANLPSAAEEGR